MNEQQILNDGYVIYENMYRDDEIISLLNIISASDKSKPTFRKTKDLFAIRQFFKEIPEALTIVFNERILGLISDLFGRQYFVVKAIYFDKPQGSNWFVAYHQDLTISVDKKKNQEGYGPWTIKQDQFAVQPPVKILEDNFTIRIHLDKTDEQNGALKVIPGSHRKGIYRPENIDWNKETEVSCCVDKGGIMIMKPLLLHASNRTTNDRERRVLHIEFSKNALQGSLKWSEMVDLVYPSKTATKDH